MGKVCFSFTIYDLKASLQNSLTFSQKLLRINIARYLLYIKFAVCQNFKILLTLDMTILYTILGPLKFRKHLVAQSLNIHLTFAVTLASNI